MAVFPRPRYIAPCWNGFDGSAGKRILRSKRPRASRPWKRGFLEEPGEQGKFAAKKNLGALKNEKKLKNCKNTLDR